MITIEKIEEDRKSDLVGTTGGEAEKIKQYYSAAKFAVQNYSEEKMNTLLEGLRTKRKNYDLARQTILDMRMNTKDQNKRINELKDHYRLTALMSQIKMFEYVLKG